MKALVVYESFFGNTERIAQAVAQALGSPPEVELRRASEVQPEHLQGLTLLVVGSPTRGFRPSPDTTALLKRIPAGALNGIKVAGFDTRISGADVKSAAAPLLRGLTKVFGWAAKPISDALAKAGGEVVAPPEGFVVVDTKGPLKEGELERATAWARQILAKQ
ncbi:MAG: nitric oxide synthase [Chloroflexi bacterium]|nr:nitric oxide synthase [Chloroflexota bacterium]